MIAVGCIIPYFWILMLQSLHIQNYAIIKEVTIQFDARLNIITGETGAGKSILMGALGLILGERADSKVLANPEEKCIVEGVFFIENYSLKSFFEQHELDYDPNCIIRREISPNGKSRAFINDTPVNLALIKELGSQLIDIVSQHQTLELNEESFQLGIVDAIAEVGDLLADYQEQFKFYKAKKQQLAVLIEQELNARKDEDYFSFILGELIEANLSNDEQTLLESKQEVLTNADQIQLLASNGSRLLSEDERGLIDQLLLLKNTIQPAAKHHELLLDLNKRIDSVIIELKDVNAEMEMIAESTTANPAELKQIEERLHLIYSLQQKHRVQNNQDLLALKVKLENDIAALGSLKSEIADTQNEIEEIHIKLTKLASSLSEKRLKAIPGIEKNIHSLLKQVEMADARVQINTTLKSDFSFSGIDAVNLLFAANKGQVAQPIQKVASGGELSRLMLCVKSLISDKVALPSIVFDEIDTGISGEAAMKVSQVMKKHASQHQVLAITHLPQIAGKANAHFYVYKTSDSKNTFTHIKQLNDQERLEEIARMLHGSNPSAKVIEAAKELIS